MFLEYSSKCPVLVETVNNFFVSFTRVIPFKTDSPLATTVVLPDAKWTILLVRRCKNISANGSRGYLQNMTKFVT